MTVRQIDPAKAKAMSDKGDAVLIDIRETGEYAREHIIGARHVPLSGFDRADFARDGNKAVIFHCASGQRTLANAERLLATGFQDVYVIDGGLGAWKAAGLPVHVNRKAPIDLLRQVQIAAGSLVALGAVLAWLVSPWFILLSGFVGAGLVLAGVTGSCAMARLLGAMPWNRLPDNPGAAAASR